MDLLTIILEQKDHLLDSLFAEQNFKMSVIAT